MMKVTVLKSAFPTNVMVYKQEELVGVVSFFVTAACVIFLFFRFFAGC